MRKAKDLAEQKIGTQRKGMRNGLIISWINKNWTDNLIVSIKSSLLSIILSMYNVFLFYYFYNMWSPSVSLNNECLFLYFLRDRQMTRALLSLSDLWAPMWVLFLIHFNITCGRVYDITQWFSTRGNFNPRGYLAMSRDTFISHSLGYSPGIYKEDRSQEYC